MLQTLLHSPTETRHAAFINCAFASSCVDCPLSIRSFRGLGMFCLFHYFISRNQGVANYAFTCALQTTGGAVP